MKTGHIPHSARARRIARVKFVALPLDPQLLPANGAGLAARAPATGFIERLRNLLIRVIGCLEAARP